VKRGGFNGKTNEIPGREAFRSFTETRNKRDVWTVATQPYKGAHFATFPPALILPCILAGCPSGGTVLDCFGGSGTTGEVAAGNGRNAVIVELNPSYCTLATNRGGLFCQQGIA
jgi:DNA modification methylase